LKHSLLTFSLAAAITLLTAAPSAAAPSSGLDLMGFDWSVSPSDDLDHFVNGRWFSKTVIPDDRSSIGTFDNLQERTEGQLHTLIDRIMATPAAEMDGDSRRISALYGSFMDQKRIERAGLAPLKAPFAVIDGIHDAHDLARVFAALSLEGITTPLQIDVHADQKSSLEHVLDIAQSGLGLPDRDYYLSDDATLKKIRGEYGAHIARMMFLAGLPDGAAIARRVLGIESALAKNHWDRVQNRDPVKTYNKLSASELASLAPTFDWQVYFDALGVRPAAVNVSQPTYVSALGSLYASTSIAAWQDYLRWQVVRAYAPYLTAKLDLEHFAFYGTALEGTPVQRPRWKRGIALVDQAVGEALGHRYVETYFPASSKARVDALVHNLIAAYAADIDTLDWMGPETKQAAHAKLDHLLLKIGYPDRWRDYSGLEFEPHELVANIRRATQFEVRRNLAKLGQPVDRSEWGMTPPTINAYYNPSYNEIVFPAGILQPPFFDPAADDAVNYGAVGAVIGHEISHGFDDEGSQFDPMGNLSNWWSEADRAAFNAKAHMLSVEYSGFEPVPGFHINGDLTLGENIADNSGVAIAYKAYLRSLNGGASSVIDGFTGAQRFYLGYAQVWREKARDNVVIELIKSDPHSMGRYRVLGTVRNQPGYYEAFGVKPGDGAYAPADARVLMW
jgi:predicted metalloendopeptidase